jgi:pSer/pThr/pTyr-binding forkhead associated (FHA) protein
MSEAVLTVLKFCFLALLYLFLWRVVRVVIAETRTPVDIAAPPPKGRKADRRRLVLRLLEPANRRDETVAVVDEMTVGRAGGCTLVLADDSYVSQVHARMFQRDTKTFVEDLGSKNGTFVNDERVNVPTRVRKGDRIRFGQTVVEVAR